MRAANKRRIREHNDRAWLAWNTARLMHFHHQPKKMPPLRSILIREGPPLRQSAEQQLQIVMAMHAAFNAVGRKPSGAAPAPRTGPAE